MQGKNKLKSIAVYLKVIGGGAAGSRAHSVQAAHELMAEVPAGRASAPTMGAFVMAMRMKSETLDELVGFLSAVHEHCAPVPSKLPVVPIPSYNGSRKLPNLTPLLALWLAREGLPVLGARPSDRTRARDHCGHLARPGHGADLERAGRRTRMVNHTDPEFGALLSGWAQRKSVDAMLLRGTEGEPVADPRHRPRPHRRFRAGGAERHAPRTRPADAPGQPDRGRCARLAGSPHGAGVERRTTPNIAARSPRKATRPAKTPWCALVGAGPGDPELLTLKALRAQGVAFEVVNGITSDLAASTALGIPWTHRNPAHGVLLVTSHTRVGTPSSDWAVLGAAAAQGLTPVI